MTTVNDDYSPSYIVRQSHNILHLDGSLKSVSNDFNITYSSQWNDYSRSLLPIPIICGTLGIVAVVFLQIALCVRICCKTCRCLPTVRASRKSNTEEMFDRDTLPRYRILSIVFLVFAVIVIGTNQMVLFGNHYLTEGVDSSRDGINFLHDLTTTLTNQGNDLISSGDVLQSDLNSAAPDCNPAADLADGVSKYFDEYVNDFLGYVDPVPGRCNDANDGLDTWESYKNSSLWVIYAVFWILIVLYSIGMFLKHKLLLQIGIGFTQIFTIIIFLIVLTLMVIVVSLFLFF